MLKEKINSDYIAAFKTKETVKKDALGILKTRITEAEKKVGNGKDLKEPEIYSIIANMIKQREQSIEIYNKNESEIAKLNSKKEAEEIVALREYLPIQMTEEELKLEIHKILGDNFTTTSQEQTKQVFSTIMREFTISHKGKYDSRKLKEIVEKILNISI